MQVRKDEIRLKILEIATDEFLKRGYENTSMRIIAKKSNTTSGNIYHYYKNKEELLDTILSPTVKNIEIMLKEHITNAPKIHITKDNALEYSKQFEENELMVFLNKKVVIFLKLESSHFLDRKEKIIRDFQEHLKEHFQIGNDDAHYAELFMNMIIECVKHVLIEHKNLEDAKVELIKFANLLWTGIIGQIR